jgi:hypothetical protein
VRHAFAHDAVVSLEDGGDERAPGGAITVALCGSWDHEPPCPLAPHHTGVQRTDGGLALRLLFAAEPGDEARVRELVDEALARGWGHTPEGGRARWELLRSGPSPVRPDEAAHAERLTGS